MDLIKVCLRKIWKKLKELDRRLSSLTCMTKGHKYRQVGGFGHISKVIQWQCKRCKSTQILEKGVIPE